ncbi:MAG: YjeE family ATPase [Candidatus Peregrinibacteria bacterium Greene0416_19]|nr:MAG: YjeE family ATPase [Candidatus Peregrinibacteria bacterium Greene0416_19]
MIDTCNMWLPSAEITGAVGRSLARTLYRFPVTVLLAGDVGAGKTTFLQGFAQGLHIGEPVVSPTFALEQRYVIGAGPAAGRELLHLDLYRLRTDQAAELVGASDDQTGIRCIEWAPRLSHPPAGSTIAISLRDERAGRRLTAVFDDIPLPARKTMDEWREEVMLPVHVRRHCDVVAALAATLAERLLQHGVLVRPHALARAAEVHDLFRFLDFRPGAEPNGYVDGEQQKETWARWRERYPGLKHEPACAAFLRDRGYPELGRIVEVHGLALPSPERQTVEQRLLFYADKRVIIDRIVTLDERFADFRARYGNSKTASLHDAWFAEAQAVERELFGA